MDRKAIKERGKQAFKANYWKTVLVAFFLALILGGLGGGSSSTVSYNQDTTTATESSYSAEDYLPEELLEDPLGENQSIDQLPAIVENQLPDAQAEEDLSFSGLVKEISEEIDVEPSVAIGYGGLALLVSIFLFGPLEVGCKSFLRKNLFRREELDELKTGFVPKYWRNVGTMFLTSLFTALGFVCFIIPGIIVSYGLAMVPYLLAEDNDIQPMDAIRKSWAMMKGHKWELFVFDLSFIGWALLSLLTLGILLFFYVEPYYYSSHAAFYEALKAQTGTYNTVNTPAAPELPEEA